MDMLNMIVAHAVRIIMTEVVRVWNHLFRASGTSNLATLGRLGNLSSF